MKKVHTPVPDELGQWNLSSIYLHWLLFAQSCFEKLADEGHFLPILSVETRLRGSGLSTWAEKRKKNISPFNLTQCSREGFVWKEVWAPKPFRTDGDDVLQCNLPISICVEVSIFRTDKLSAEDEKVQILVELRSKSKQKHVSSF